MHLYGTIFTCSMGELGQVDSLSSKAEFQKLLMHHPNQKIIICNVNPSDTKRRFLTKCKFKKVAEYLGNSIRAGQPIVETWIYIRPTAEVRQPK